MAVVAICGEIIGEIEKHQYKQYYLLFCYVFLEDLHDLKDKIQLKG